MIDIIVLFEHYVSYLLEIQGKCSINKMNLSNIFILFPNVCLAESLIL